MRTIHIAAIACGLNLCMPHPASAGPSLIIGAGVQSCGSWTEAAQLDGSTKWGNIEWMEGYLSGQAQLSGLNLVKGQDMNGLKLWVDNYCQAHPLYTVETAVIALREELIKTAEKSP